MDRSSLIEKLNENVECAKVLKKGFIRKTIDKRLIKKSEIKEYNFVGENSL